MRRCAALLAAAVIAVVASPAGRAEQSPVSADTRGAVAPPASLPPATDVLARYTRAIGGERILRKYRSRRTTGRFDLRTQGIGGPLEILAAAPDRILIRITLAGLGEMLRGYDGEVGWSMDPAVGPRVLTGRELDETRYAADFYADLYNPADYTSMSVVRRETFDGRDCFTVKLVRVSGLESLEYFDVATGLRIGGRMTSTSMMGSVPDVITVFGEYRDFGGILVPISATQRALGVESLLTVEQIAYDTVRDEELRPPAAILTLIKG
jgi:hypothetical protein